MSEVEGAAAFQVSGDAYDAFMGRYSRQLAAPFADAAGIAPGLAVLDVGCGPGALTGVLVDRLGTGSVAAFDPSPPFVHDCAARFPGVDVRLGRVEQIPFGEDTFDVALAQLVLHFVSDADLGVRELRRVLRPGGTVSLCVWDLAEGMEMLSVFWDAALALDPEAPDEAHNLRFGGAGEIPPLLEAGGFDEISESTLGVASTYAGFDELWSGFLLGIGPAGTYCVGLPDDHREALRARLFERLGSPSGSFTLDAVARYATGRTPR